MSNFKVFSAVLRGRWLLDESWVMDHLPIIHALLEGKPMAFDDETDRKNTRIVSANIDGLVRYSRWDGWSAATKNSFAQHDIIGPVMHYENCGDPGTHDLGMRFREADENPLIKGHFLNIDSPGGEVDGTESFADLIASANKPVVAFINNGMMASAATWIGSAANEIYADGPLSSVGSVGVYTTLYDYREAFKKAGIDVRQIYAPQSKDKNRNYHDALDGKDDGIKNDLSFIADRFINTIKQNRGHALSSDEWQTGKMFYTDKAVKIGLIDGMKNRSQAVARLKELSGGSKSIKPLSNNKLYMKFPNITALAGKASVTADELDLANADLTEAGITGHTLVSEEMITEAAVVTEQLTQANQDLTAANAQVTELTGQLETANAQVAALTSEVKTLKNVIARRAAGDTGTASSKGATGKSEIDDTPPAGPVAAHNQYLDSLGI